ncbi:MAG: 23S rRNA (adenine(2030)-N(6))-methyltransferase RlmJ [Magnetococcales bacterium]|nr:23S rRNA (adenine(2030)-N(6))-methyltransferase RlmJ [Magnetococcales bacterium]
MLSYQHDYHAGGPADVHKHGSLAVVLTHMTTKNKPMSYLESHAGAGLYDLQSPMAEKTGEARQGIERWLALDGPLPDHPYRRVVTETRNRFGPHHYPGSPWIARLLLRATDSMHLMELHPGTQTRLKGVMRDDNRIHIHHRDSYEGLMAILPPNPRRSLIVIDPSYEVKTEYQQVGQLVLDSHRKCPEAVIMLWYPLLKDNLHHTLCRRLEQANLPKWARREVLLASPSGPKRLYGSGLMFVNLPHGIETSLDQTDHWVPRILPGETPANSSHSS